MEEAMKLRTAAIAVVLAWSAGAGAEE